MGHIVSIGINHKNTRIDLREKFFLPTVERELVLSTLKNNPAVLGAFVLSTCNRTEIYADLLESEPQIILEALFKVKKLDMQADLVEHFYFYKEQQAVQHLFRVATGLESLVLGEKQVLGQVKEAVEVSRKNAMMTRDLNILSNLAVRAGKKAQTETEVGFGGSSVSWAAVVMMQKRLETLSGKTILVIGAGKMGHMAAEQLTNKDVSTVYIMNRSCDKAVSVAEETHGIAVGFWEMKDILCKVDACICSAGAPHYLIEQDMIREVMEIRQGRKLVLIDVSMPRNIQPEVALESGVELFTIDQLDQVVEDSVRRRQNAIADVENIIRQKEREYSLRLEKSRIWNKESVEVL